MFVPGIMGSRLRLAGTDGTGKSGGLPNLRWDPDSMSGMWWNYSGTSGAHRRRMMIGAGHYSGSYLEVHNSDPVGNGLQGVLEGSYHDFLAFLRDDSHWDGFNSHFTFPVYAVGYNWTDTNYNSGKALASRIDEIIEQAKAATGECRKVILITHSMGGLVSRSASEVHGACPNIMGIIHGVQPATGSTAAFWRVKAGFEGMGPTSRVLGNSGPTVTPVLGNIPGGLELLPNSHFRTNAGGRAWLTVSDDGTDIVALPTSDPYEEIYKVKGTGSELDHPDRKYWGLVDPDLLDPANNPPPEGAAPEDNDMIAAGARPDPWSQYLKQLRKAQAFHGKMGTKTHPSTYTVHGIGHETADRIRMEVESVWIERSPYPKRGFRGYFRNDAGDRRQAVLQDPDGDGDGTVPTSSASALDSSASSPPAPTAVRSEHEPAFKENDLQTFVVEAIRELCRKRLEERGIGD